MLISPLNIKIKPIALQAKPLAPSSNPILFGKEDDVIIPVNPSWGWWASLKLLGQKASKALKILHELEHKPVYVSTVKQLKSAVAQGQQKQIRFQYGMDLIRADLRGLDLSHVNFTLWNGARETDECVDLEGAQMQKARLEGACLVGAHLQKVNLTEAVLTGARLTNAKMRGCVLHTAKLQGAWLIGADLTDTDFSLADLQKAHLEHATLHGSNFTWANLTRASLKGAQMDWATFYEAKMRGCDLRKADLSNSNFTGANLREARLYQAIGDNTKFDRAILAGAVLERATFSGSSFYKAYVAGVNPRGALLYHCDITDMNMKTMRYPFKALVHCFTKPRMAETTSNPSFLTADDILWPN